MSTPHNEAQKKDIAKIVLMPGDPLRAKLIAETYLEDAVCYNTVRNMLGYTGNYKGKRISVQSSGMGVPSMGIYSMELYRDYDVDTIIRVGSAGAISDSLSMGDVVIGMGLCTDSAYVSQYNLPGTYTPVADFNLVKLATEIMEERGVSYQTGVVLTSDLFYTDEKDAVARWKKMNVLCVEMESLALYCNAARLGKRALTMLTISDIPLKGEAMEADERRTSFTVMLESALRLAEKADV
ncbi:purine-nucleoside phosphorylase [Faecalicatena orotica]|uniref:Purine nucleoside phosphorylase DeoD-type n=1 Tax=Faecalicatena orotica TaxID=1544 RepID=A0A2Y9BLG8_9FIRM|nr:purine-nucleoside phosphorylase [Faecalicatena orotica]PWJ21445.1 purine-nucleoside phosphorylase [Faecalicatena orotica]SSA58420.1 purine-nucleoside phosphorylase [Faecalicatena orotica]